MTNIEMQTENEIKETFIQTELNMEGLSKLDKEAKLYTDRQKRKKEKHYMMNIGSGSK